MNGVEQQAAGTRYEQLAAQIGDLGTILEELDERIVELAAIVKVIDERVVELGTGTAAAYDTLAATVDRLQAEIALERRKRQHEIDACETALANEERLRNQYRGSGSAWRRLRWIVRGY